MNIKTMSLEEMQYATEKQEFDRKSAKIDATAIATPIIAFANADGGLLAVGIEDDGSITGIDDFTSNINEILRAPFDFCFPSINVVTEKRECVDNKGKQNHILLIYVPQSSELHANHRDEVFLRIGDKSKKLSFEERMQLMYAKGTRYFEDEPVYGSSIDDIDMDVVSDYCKRIGYGKSAEEYIRQNKSYIVKNGNREELSGAALLLFGKEPQQYFKRARVRFIRYDGTEAKVGTQMNVVKDKIFEGRILQMVEQSVEFVRGQIKEHTYLGKDGKFVTEPEYPEFAWKEIIVNAIAHRDYSIKGTDIQIKMFDDHMTVESPGTLPGIVRISNMRQVHYSRNPKIAEFLHDYEYVREYGEGVDRLYMEMSKAGLPAPEYRMEAFMLHATISNKRVINTPQDTQQDTPQDTPQDSEVALREKIIAYCKEPKKKSDIAKYCGYSDERYFTRRYLKPLLDSDVITMTIPLKPNSKNQRYVLNKIQNKI